MNNNSSGKADTPFLDLGWAFIASGYHIAQFIKKQNSDKIRKALVILMFVLTVALVVFGIQQKYQILKYIYFSCTYPFLTALIFYAFVKRIESETEFQIKRSDVYEQRPDFKSVRLFYSDPEKIPIGFGSKKDVHYLEKRKLNQHLLVSGPTGAGKTSLLFNSVRHAMIHMYPVCFIDPKGSKKDLLTMKRMMIESGRDPKDLKVISFSNPTESFFYNILKMGNNSEIVNKILGSLKLEQSYYKGVATSYISTLVDCFSVLNIEPTVSNLLDVMETDSKKQELTEKLSDLAAKDPKVSLVFKGFLSMKKESKENLSGLISQLRTLNSGDFASIISNNDEDRDSITIAEVVKNNWVLYIQTNALSYKDVGEAVGKMFLEDIKLYAASASNSENTKFFSVIIDEFGSFATESFIPAAQLVRSAGISLQLFFQGFAALKDVSPNFHEHIMTNTYYKISFRQGVTRDAEEWASLAGTIDTVARSRQTDSNNMNQYTGAGNERDVKEMRVEHDVFKELRDFQFVLIEKPAHYRDAVKLMWGINGADAPI